MAMGGQHHRGLIGLLPPPSLPPLLLFLLVPTLPDRCVASEQWGAPLCWGLNEHGMLDVPATLASDIAMGRSNTCAINEAGGVWCVGDNPEFPLVVPSDIAASTQAQQVVVGQHFACVLLADATVRCWGNNQFGQSSVPQGLGAVKQLTAGWIHACALLETGSIRCWGWGGFARTSPPGGQYSLVVSGMLSEHSCAILISGTATCWGWNGHGQCNVPWDLGKVKDLATGFGFSCAVREDGTVRCWGQNNLGQTDVPSDLALVSRIIVGHSHACAWSQKGNVTCWGQNYHGESDVPAEIRQGGQAAFDVSGSHFATCALLATSTTSTTSTTSSTSSTSTTSTSTTATATSTTSTSCLVNNVMSCSVPRGTYEVRGFTNITECLVATGVDEPEPVVFINISACPPKRTYDSTSVVDTHVLEPMLARGSPWRDPEIRSVVCSCQSPLSATASVGFGVPTLAPLVNQPGTGSFEPSIQMCADDTCEASAVAAPPGVREIHFKAASGDTSDDIEVTDLTTCPGPDPNALECRPLVRDNCIVESSLQISFRRAGRQVLWSMIKFAWLDNPTVHLFAEVQRCNTEGNCGVCATEGQGRGRRLQASPEGPLTQLELTTSGDEPVLLVPFPYRSLQSSRGTGSAQREVHVPLLSKGNVSADALAHAAIAGLNATAPEVKVTGVALVRQLDSHGRVHLVFQVGVEVPVASVDDHSQLDTSALTELLARLGLAVAPTPTPTPTLNPAPAPAPQPESASSTASCSIWTVFALLSGHLYAERLRGFTG